MPLIVPDGGEKNLGVPHCIQGVIGGVILGVDAAPKNIPPTRFPAPKVLGISIPNRHFSASNSKSKHPVPIFGS